MKLISNFIQFLYNVLRALKEFITKEKKMKSYYMSLTVWWRQTKIKVVNKISSNWSNKESRKKFWCHETSELKEILEIYTGNKKGQLRW